jgi:hypothetical protein
MWVQELFYFTHSSYLLCNVAHYSEVDDIFLHLFFLVYWLGCSMKNIALVKFIIQKF